MTWVCVIFHIQVFIDIRNLHVKNDEYPDPSFCYMTYARFVINVKIYPKSKVKYIFIVKTKNVVMGS